MDDGTLNDKETFTGSGGESVVYRRSVGDRGSRGMRIELHTDASGTRTGFRLQYRRPASQFCDSSPCQNGGSCNDVFEACICRWNFGGIHCETGKY